MGELGVGDVNGARPNRLAMILSRSMWKPSLTSKTRLLFLVANQRATPATDEYVLEPAGSATAPSAGSPSFPRYRRPTSASLRVSREPVPPVTRITGASPRWYSVPAGSRRARNTGDARPLYCAAPSAEITSAVVAA